MASFESKNTKSKTEKPNRYQEKKAETHTEI